MTIGSQKNNWTGISNSWLRVNGAL